jgi:hypothetical protein
MLLDHGMHVSSDSIAFDMYTTLQNLGTRRVKLYERACQNNQEPHRVQAMLSCVIPHSSQWVEAVGYEQYEIGSKRERRVLYCRANDLSQKTGNSTEHVSLLIQMVKTGWDLQLKPPEMFIWCR